MNKFVKKELEKCRVKLPYWDDTTVNLIVPGPTKNENTSLSTDEHDIEIKNYVIVEPPGFTLSQSWNNGTVPPEKFMSVVFVDTRGKMTKVQGKGITTDIFWEGWLPNKSFEVIV